MDAYTQLLESYGDRLLNPAHGSAGDAFDPWTEALAALAESFVEKRVGELKRALPLTIRAAPSVLVRYRRFLMARPSSDDPGVYTPGLAEGLRAWSTLRAELAADAREAEYAPWILDYELTLGASRADGAPRHLHAPVPLHELVEVLVGGLRPTEPEPGPGWEYRFADRVRWRRR